MKLHHEDPSNRLYAFSSSRKDDIERSKVEEKAFLHEMILDVPPISDKNVRRSGPTHPNNSLKTSQQDPSKGHKSQ